jgi:hypothetical protein
MKATAIESDLFEWTVTDAPFAEPTPGQWIDAARDTLPAASTLPSATGAVLQIITFFRSVSGILIGAVGVVLVTVWLTEGWGQWLTEQTLRGTVLREEQAALAGDAVTLLALTNTAGRAWLDQRLERAANGLFAPSPLRGLRPVAEAGRVQTVTRRAADFYQVEVARAYTNADGNTYTFTLPQFYQRADGVWQRTLAPESYWGAHTRLIGRFVEINHYATDRDFALELLPYLDEVLARFCADWGCADQPPISVDLANRYYQWPDVPALRPADPLLFTVLPPHVTRYPDYALLVPSPHEVGYPAEPTGRDLWRRAVGVQMLFAAMDRLAFRDGRRDAVGNAYFYALVVRESVRLGLDPVSVLRGPPLPIPERLTTQRYWDFRGGVWRRPDVIRNALVMLNEWLAEAPPETDRALLGAMPAARSPEEWLAAGAGLSPEAAAAQVSDALARIVAAP